MKSWIYMLETEESTNKLSYKILDENFSLKTLLFDNLEFRRTMLLFNVLEARALYETSS